MIYCNPHAFGWTPAKLSPTFWYDAQDPAAFTLSGGNITGWINKAGATTATAINRTGGTVTVNGKAMVRFNGTNQLFLVANNAEHNFGSADFSLFAVSRSDDANRGAVVGKGGGTPGYTMRYNNPDSNAGDFVHFARETAVAQHFGSIVAADVTYNDNTVRILGMVRDGGTLRAYRGATEVATADVSLMGSIDDATRAFNIGALAGASPAGAGAVHLLKGDVGEVIAVKRTLSAAERAKLISYLTHKWSL